MEHGGFGVAFQITELALNQSITVLHRAGSFPNPLVGNESIPNPGGAGMATFAFVLWMDAPQVTLSTANGGFAVSEVRLFGNTVLGNAGLASGFRDLRIVLRVRTLVEGTVVLVPAEGGINAPNFPFEIKKKPTFELIASLTPLAVLDAQVFVIEGPPFPIAWTEFFASNAFRGGLGLNLAGLLTNIPTALPKRIVPFLRALSVGTNVNATVVSVVGNGYLTFGLNLTSPWPPLSVIGTAGDVDRFLGSGDLAVVIDEKVAPLIAEQLRTDMNDHIAATVTWLSIKFKHGYLAISGLASADAGSAEFSMRATPMLGRPGWEEVVDDEYGQWTLWHEPTDEIWLDITHLNLDESLAWWAILSLIGGSVLLGAATSYGGAPQFFLNMVHQIMVGIQIKIVTQGQEPLISAHQQIALTGNAKPLFDVRIFSLKVFDDRIRSIAEFKPSGGVGPGSISGPSSIDVIESVDPANEFTFLLKPRLLAFHPDDPELRVRWQVRRANSSVVYKTHETGAWDEDRFRFTTSLADLALGTSSTKALTITVRVYRTGGVGSFDYWNDKHLVIIADRLDRTHPYTKWSHLVVTPDVIVHPNGEHEKIGKRVFMRESVIHRTDVPGRCKFVSQFTADIQAPTYLDELPFAPADIDQHRDEVCDFCFYGGPQNKKVKADWSEGVDQGKVSPQPA